MSSYQDIVSKKNQWLASQVDVDYPTAESIQGRDLYLTKESSVEYVERAVQTKKVTSELIDDIYLVDFHRLTVMFAQMQASQWSDPEHNAFVLEFFAQIILSDAQPMYVGFKKGTPVACALVTRDGHQLLISDIVNSYDDESVSAQFADLLIEIVNTNGEYASYFMPNKHN